LKLVVPPLCDSKQAPYQADEVKKALVGKDIALLYAERDARR